MFHGDVYHLPFFYAGTLTVAAFTRDAVMYPRAAAIYMQVLEFYGNVPWWDLSHSINRTLLNWVDATL